MKKYVASILVTLLVSGLLIGCAGGAGASGADPFVFMPRSCITGSTKFCLGSDLPDPLFSSEEYQKLLALKFDGYEHMSISEFRNRVWSFTDEKENHDLLERFSQSEMLYGCRDSNDAASFLFYILNPLTGEKWRAEEFGGAEATDYPDTADNAMLEFSFTLMIRDADQLTVGEYNEARIGMTNGLQEILKGKADWQLRDEAFMEEEIAKEAERLIGRWSSEKLQVSAEYVYTSLSRPEVERYVRNMEREQERREYPNGTREDYQSLFTLKTPDYQSMAIADFNMSLLNWANENYERMERINCDTAYDDFSTPLTEDERRFVVLSVNFSGIENARYVRSNYTGQAEEAPSYGVSLPQKTEEQSGRSAWCDLYYRFSYQIADKKTLTVGERDHCIGGMMDEIQKFWEEADIDALLYMEKSEIVKKLQKIADAYSTDQLVITALEDSVSFERMDERDVSLESQGQ